MSDTLIRLLGELPAADPDRARSERVRLRCHARLVRQSERASASRAPARPSRTAPLWPSLIATLGIAYLADVIVQALGLYGLL
jgi:hypothetical protein